MSRSMVLIVLGLTGAACSGTEVADDSHRVEASLASFRDGAPSILEPRTDVHPTWHRPPVAASDRVVPGSDRGVQRHSSDIRAPAERHLGLLSAEHLLTVLARESDLVVIGQVAGAVSVASGPHGLPGIHTGVSLTGVEHLKGREPPDFWVQGGTLGKRARRIVGRAPFTPGERLLVFLRRAPNGSLWPTRRGLGKWAVRDGESGQRAVLEANEAVSAGIDEIRAIVTGAEGE